MPLPFFVAALLGKTALGLALKGLAGKAGAVGAKGLLGHHAHHGLALRVTRKAAETVLEHGVRSALERRRPREDGR